MSGGGTLYRSPNVIVDAHEWHILVRICHGRAVKQYMWRPLSLKNYMWKPISGWVGPRPKGLYDRFSVFHVHVNRAMETDRVRKEAIAALSGKRPTGAMQRNVA